MSQKGREEEVGHEFFLEHKDMDFLSRLMDIEGEDIPIFSSGL